MNFSSFYQPPKTNQWQGRVDDPQNTATLRWHQMVRPLDIKHLSRKDFSKKEKNIVLLGFASDEGVRRNQGRPGAKLGPKHLRKALSNLPCHSAFSLFDAGNIVCFKKNLEKAQENLAFAIQNIVNHDALPIVLGGGHEVAYGHYLGLFQAVKTKKKNKVGIINFDAHFDLRSHLKASSGTPFLQIANLCKKEKHPFLYYCFGIQKSSNTKQLFDTAKQLKVEYSLASETHLMGLQKLKQKLKRFLKTVDYVYTTVCLDAFLAPVAPGVSAPSTCGILPDVAIELIHEIGKSKKVIGFDIAELSPPYDIDERTAKLGAQLIFNFVDSVTP